MSSACFSCEGAELREVSGEMNSIIATGTFTINRKGNGPQCYFQVGDNSWELSRSNTQGPYKALDAHTTIFTTDDYMTTLYLTLPKSTSIAQLAMFARVLACVAEGKDPASLHPPEADHAGKATSHSSTQQAPPANQIQAWGQFVGALGAAAQHFAGEAVRKAQEDTQTVLNALPLGGKGQEAAHQPSHT